MCTNILFISNKLNLNMGGSNHSLDMMARSLCDRGYAVRIKTLNVRNDNSVPDDAPYAVEPIEGTRGSESLPNVIGHVYRALRDQESWADLVHCFFTPAVPVCGLYRARGGETPVVGRLNNYLMFCPNISAMEKGCYLNCTTAKKLAHDDKSGARSLANLPVYLARTHAVPRLASRADRLFAISPQVRDIHVANGVDPETMAVVPNFSDPIYEGDGNSLNPDDSRDPDADLDALYVGRVAEEKGTDLLVEAIDGLDDERVTIHVVGDGPALSELKRRAKRSDAGRRIVFHGRVPHDDLSTFYVDADLFVHPGRWPEPFGRTILEAIQHGCPVLASDVGAPPWIAGDSGETFESGSADDLREKLLALADAPERLAAMRANADHEVQRFDRERVLNRIEAQYRSVLA
ncbi:glycosyltransferase family 4 protein [Haloferacaceae archaeon DSL9]